jgi:hypothetical protein
MKAVRIKMDEIPIPGSGNVRDLHSHVLAQYGPPAYIRRGAQVEAAYEQLFNHCRRQRDEWLAMPRLCLGVLHTLAGEWPRLRPLVADDGQLAVLVELETILQPRSRLETEATSSTRKLRLALRDLVESLERFNRRWQVFLPTVDLTSINQLRDGYNRYYVLEKECAVRSPRIARQGFRPLPPLAVTDLAAALPPLPVPLVQR